MKSPEGFYYLLPGSSDIPDLTTISALTQTNINGFRARTGWQRIQPTGPGSFDWTQVDNAITALADNGKRLGLGIAAGINSPEWVYDTCTRYTLDPENDEDGTMPLPWEQNFIDLWTTFVSAMGARYDSNGTVSYIIVAGFMQNMEAFLAKTQVERTELEALAIGAGFTGISDAYQFAGEACIDAFAAAFPNTSIILTSARPFPFPGNTQAQARIKDYGLDTYPGHFGWMTAQLHAAEGPWLAPTPVEYPKGYQAVFGTGNLDRLYVIIPDPVPVPPQPLIDLIENGISQTMHFLELWPADVTAAAHQATLDLYNPLLQSFNDEVQPPVEPPPPPPPPPDTTPPPAVEAVIEPRPILGMPTATGTDTVFIAPLRTIKRRAPDPGRAPGTPRQLIWTTPHVLGSNEATLTWLPPL